MTIKELKKKKKEWIGCCFSSGTVSSKQSFENPYRYVQMTSEQLVFSVSLKWPLLIILGKIRQLVISSRMSVFPIPFSSHCWYCRGVHSNSPLQLSNTYRLKSKRGKETLPKASGPFLCLLESGELPLLWFKIPKRVRWRSDSNGNCDIWMGKMILGGGNVLIEKTN